MEPLDPQTDKAVAGRGIIPAVGAAMRTPGAVSAPAQDEAAVETAGPADGSFSERALAVAAEVRLGRLLTALAGVIALLGVLGLAYSQAKPGDALAFTGLRSIPLGLDTEYSVPALFSGVLLLAAAYAGYLVAAVASSRRERRTVLLFGAFLAFMAVDELLAIHEGLESLAGVPWKLLYAPVILAGGALWLATLLLLRGERTAQLCLLAGAAAWSAAQILEQIQYEDGKLVARWSILPEEVLEMTGSTLFGLALLLAVRTRLARRRERAGSARAATTP